MITFPLQMQTHGPDSGMTAQGHTAPSGGVRISLRAVPSLSQRVFQTDPQSLGSLSPVGTIVLRAYHSTKYWMDGPVVTCRSKS